MEAILKIMEKSDEKTINCILKKKLILLDVPATGIFPSDLLAQWHHMEPADLQIPRLYPRYISL